MTRNDQCILQQILYHRFIFLPSTIDAKTKTCPHMYGSIDSFKIDWSKVSGGKEWFMKKLSSVLSEMFSIWEVSDFFNDDHGFCLDKDH